MIKRLDFVPLFAQCGRAVADALHNRAGVSLSEPVGSVGAGGDQTLRIDQVAEQAALAFLTDVSVPFNILSEEIGLIDRGAETTLIIDPIDQTLNAQHRFPYFAFSIAAFRNGTVLAGHVRNLASGDTFHAVKGDGAFMNDRPIQVSDCTSLAKAYCFVIRAGQGEDRSLYHRFFFETRLLRVTGCSSLDLCYVASGQWDALVHAELREGHGEKVVDVAAAKLVVEEAGGVVRDADGGEFAINLDLRVKRPILAAATPELMDEILAVFHGH